MKILLENFTLSHKSCRENIFVLPHSIMNNAKRQLIENVLNYELEPN